MRLTKYFRIKRKYIFFPAIVLHRFNHSLPPLNFPRDRKDEEAMPRMYKQTVLVTEKMERSKLQKNLETHHTVYNTHAKDITQGEKS